MTLDERREALKEMAHARFENLTPGELTLLEAVAAGEAADLSPDETGRPDPDTATPEQTIRAAVLRWLLTDRDAHVHFERAEVWLSGAVIEESLDLEYADVPVVIQAWRSVFTEPIIMRWARMRSVNLSGSRAAEVNAEGVAVRGNLVLREEFECDTVVRLLGARISSDLTCGQSHFGTRIAVADAAHAMVLMADGSEIDGRVFLNNGFTAYGEVRFIGARIGGVLDCSGGKYSNHTLQSGQDGNDSRVALALDSIIVRDAVFLSDGFSSNGEVRLNGARIGSQLTCEEGAFSHPNHDAINAEGAHVDGSFILRRARINGCVNLSAMNVRTLVDDEDSWPDEVELGHFRYDEINATAPLDAGRRIKWLARQRSPRELNPQPWRYVASVLRKQGHEDDAQKIMIEYWWRRTRQELPEFLRTGWRRRVLHWCGVVLGSIMGLIERVLALPLRVLFGAVIGFGYARWRAFIWIIGLWIVGVAVFGWNSSDPVSSPMREAQPLAMRSRIALSAIDARIAEIHDLESPPPERIAELQRERREHEWVDDRYPAFNPWVYSFDTLLPIVDFNQETYWTPKDGWRRSFFLPFQIAMGWIITTLFVVSFTGLVRRAGED